MSRDSYRRPRHNDRGGQTASTTFFVGEFDLLAQVVDGQEGPLELGTSPGRLDVVQGSQ